MASETGATETRIRIDDQNELVIAPADWGDPENLDVHETFRGCFTNTVTGIKSHNRFDAARAIAPPGALLLDPEAVAALRRLLDSYAARISTTDRQEDAAYGIICAALEGPR